MAATQDQIDRLEAALAKGVLEVQTENERIRYTSTAEMLRALAYLRGQIQAQEPTSPDAPVTIEYTWFDSQW